MEKFYRKPLIPYGFLRVILFSICWLFFAAVVEFFGLEIISEWFPNVDQRSVWFLTISRTLLLVVTLILLWFFRKKVDRRPYLTDWFALTERKLDLVVGFIVGALMIASMAFLLYKLEFIRFYPGELDAKTGVNLVLLFFVAALVEELVFRGYIQENLMEDMPPFLALIITSVLFMLLHMNNPNLGTVPIVNLFLAGILLGASFMYTKNLWFPWGLHWSWNLFQGPVFGFEVSGLNFESLYNQELLGDALWTGGNFGFEGSLLATVIIILTSGVIFFQFSRFKKVDENS